MGHTGDDGEDKEEKKTNNKAIIHCLFNLAISRQDRLKEALRNIVENCQPRELFRSFLLTTTAATSNCKSPPRVSVSGV